MIKFTGMAAAPKMMRLGVAMAALLAAGAALSNCGGSMNMQPPEQGLQGNFFTYGPPETISECKGLVTQASKDSCRHMNERVIEAPYQGGIVIRNLTTGEKHAQDLDAQGHYRIVLTPDQYEVCVNGECSDPIEVKRGEFLPYGQRLPRKPADKAQAKSQP